MMEILIVEISKEGGEVSEGKCGRRVRGITVTPWEAGQEVPETKRE